MFVATNVCTSKVPFKNQSQGQSALLFKEELLAPGSTTNIKITFDINQGSAGYSCLGSECNIPGNNIVNLTCVDPPILPFTDPISGRTFNQYLDGDGTSTCRNGCSSDGLICPIGYVGGGTLKHETCHQYAGFRHELSNNINNSNPVVFNVPVLDQYFQSIGWSLDDIQTNILDAFGGSGTSPPTDAYGIQAQVYGSNFDISSIMLYSLPDKFLLSGPSLKTNFDFSDTDKQTLQQIYPRTTNSSTWPVVNYYFPPLNTNNEWKKYWIRYVILYEIAPLVGITFNFPNFNDPVLDASQVVEKTFRTQQISNPLPNNLTSTSTSINLSTGAIVGIVVGAVFLLIILLIIILR